MAAQLFAHVVLSDDGSQELKPVEPDEASRNLCEPIVLFGGKEAEEESKVAPEESSEIAGAPAELPPFNDVDDYGRRVYPGDILSFRRRMYSHDTIYIGGGYVVHLWNTERRVDFEGNSSWFSSLSGRARSNRAQIVRSHVSEVRQGCKIKVRIISRRLRYSREEIVARALSQIGKAGEYHLFMRNCQHFTTWCQGHITSSRDISTYISLAAALVVSGKGISVGKNYLGLKGSLVGFIVGAVVGAFVGLLGMETFVRAHDSVSKGPSGHLKWLQ